MIWVYRMISNEYGLHLINIPFSGYDLFTKAFAESNNDLKIDDEKLDGCIEYENFAIVRSPYLRAAYIYKNGMKLRKGRDLKQQNFSDYFENNLNKWDTLEEDLFTSQYNYIKDIDDVELWKYEELLDSWFDLNDFLKEFGVRPIKCYSELDPIKNWHDFYEEPTAVELVEYIFEDDFENLGYSKL